MGSGELTNGELLAAAEAEGFTAMLAADQNIRYQQNLAGRRIAIIEVSTSHWETVRDHADQLIAAVEAVVAGGYAMVTLPRPPKARRLHRG